MIVCKTVHDMLMTQTNKRGINANSITNKQMKRGHKAIFLYEI